MERLTFAGHLANQFITSKLTSLLVLSCIFFGVIAWFYTPREENPKILVPAAKVIVSLPGATPQEVETLLLKPLESAVQNIDGVDHYFGTALSARAIVNIQFKVGEDKEHSLVKLADRVTAARGSLPTESTPPIIQSVDSEDIPFMVLTFASEKYDAYALTALADKFKDGIKNIPSVSSTYIQGGKNRQISVEVDPQRLESFHLTLNQIRIQMANADAATQGGDLILNGDNHKIFFDGLLHSVEDLSKTIVGVHGAKPIYLRDVANIFDFPQTEQKKISRFSYGSAAQPDSARLGEMQAVSLAIAKKPNTNAVVVAKEIMARVNRMEADMLPSEARLVVTRNYGEKADLAVRELLGHLGFSVLAVIVITAIFLGVKEAIIVGVTVPLVLAMTIAGTGLLGLTINRITLDALTLALGLLVDDAIVVVENIHRHYHLAHTHSSTFNKRAATVLAASEIGNPTNLATLAVIVVFCSMLFITGMPGQFFNPISVAVPLAVFVSLIIAYSIVPWASFRWLKPSSPSSTKSGFLEQRMLKCYRTIMLYLISESKYRKIFLITTFLAILLALLQPAWQFIRPQGLSGQQSLLGVKMGMMPKENKTTFNISITMPDRTPIEKTDQLAREVENLLKRNRSVLNFQTWVGQTGVTDFTSQMRGTDGREAPNIAEIRVNLTAKNLRTTSSMGIVRELRKEIFSILPHYPGSNVQLVEDPPGPPVAATVQAEIYGPELSKLRELSTKIKSEFEKTFDMVETSESQIQSIPQTILTVDKEKAALSGLSSAEISTALQRILEGEVLGRVHIQREPNPVLIKLEIPRKFIATPTELANIKITNSLGQQIPLSMLVKVETGFVEKPVQHKDGVRVTYVGGELGDTPPIYAVLDLDRRLNGMRVDDSNTLTTDGLGIGRFTPDPSTGYRLLWDGEMRQMLDLYGDVAGAFGFAITLIFFALVAYYQSYGLPLIAMAAIPLCLIGIFPGHNLLGQQFSGTSMIGIIALAGIVVRNSLLLIDFVKDYLSQGMALDEALIESGAVRLRPITLTTLTIMIGSVVLLLDSVFVGMAITLIFGTMVSAALTVFVIPILLRKYYQTRLPKEQMLSKKIENHVG